MVVVVMVMALIRDDGDNYCDWDGIEYCETQCQKTAAPRQTWTHNFNSKAGLYSYYSVQESKVERLLITCNLLVRIQ